MSSGAGHITAAAQPTVYVLAVGSVSTRAALMAGIPLSRGMRARLVVLVPQVVPYPLAVDQPAEATEFIHRRFRSLVKETTLTYGYRIERGVPPRAEWRGDFSERPFFLTDTVGRLRSD